MNKKHNFIIELMSRIDDKIIEKNLNKRYILWNNRAKKRPSPLISTLALAACFLLILTSTVVIVLNINGNGKQVPIYQGMTVSNEAPLLPDDSSSLADFHAPVELSQSVKGKKYFSAADLNKNSNATLKPDIDLTRSTYYAQKNEDIYIYVHLSNPDDFEILSFTLNGVKYSSNMFEYGSDLETLILKCNVGDVEGMKKYTIDAIKYVDGEKIKDVRMDGKKTIDVLVGSSTDSDSTDVILNPTFDGWDLMLSPEWSESFTGERIFTSLVLYDGEKLLLELPADSVSVTGLPEDSRLVLAASYVKNGQTFTQKHVIQTPAQSEGLVIIDGMIRGRGTCDDSVLYINMPVADNAFFEDRYISKVYFGSGVTEVGENSFLGCKELTETVFSEGATKIGSGAFSGCSAMTDITLPETLTDIKEGAFVDCAFEEIELPSSLSKLGEGVFMDCKALKAVYINSKNVKFVPSLNVSFYDPSSGSYLPGTPVGTTFEDCRSLSDIYFSGTLEEWSATMSDMEFWHLIRNDITVHCTDGDTVIERNDG